MSKKYKISLHFKNLEDMDSVYFKHCDVVMFDPTIPAYDIVNDKIVYRLSANKYMLSTVQPFDEFVGFYGFLMRNAPNEISRYIPLTDDDFIRIQGIKEAIAEAEREDDLAQ